MTKQHKNVASLMERRATARIKRDARAYYERCGATVDLHRQNLLRTTRERARQGDVTVAPQYRRFLPESVRARMERAGWPPAVRPSGGAPASATRPCSDQPPRRAPAPELGAPTPGA
ncbi:hypothetical protein [Amycolatopsis sp. cg9]|uniref:hypothetical protein n=1 Tax=Amycolatopsis sp. cg9 TaxID=3238801 RepID=UPI003524D43A